MIFLKKLTPSLNLKQALILILCLICLAAGYLIRDRLGNNGQLIITNTVIDNVDSTAIIQKARMGYITQAEALRKFGRINTDTVKIFNNKVIVDTVFVNNGVLDTSGNTTPLIKYIESDTDLTFKKRTKTDSLEVILELKQRAYLEPLYIFEDSLKLVRFSHYHIDSLNQMVPFSFKIKDRVKWFMIGAGSIEILRLIGVLLR